MFKQVILPILGVMAFIVIVGLLTQKPSLFGFINIAAPSVSPPQKTVTIGSHVINIQKAQTEDEKMKGLSGVSSLDAGSGMLFVFSPKLSPVFWMKGMLIPLDFIWISDGKVIRIDKNIPAPAPGTNDNQLKTYSAGQPVDYILEVNAGFCDKNNIEVGDSVDLSKI